LVAKLKYAPDAGPNGMMCVHVLTVNGLRDISGNTVKDFSSFRDFTIVFTSLTLLVFYIVLGCIFFTEYFTACDVLANRCCVDFGLDEDDDTAGSQGEMLCSFDTDECVDGCVGGFKPVRDY
jgi:hypothetical protein